MPATVWDLECVAQERHAEAILAAPFDPDTFTPKGNTSRPETIARQKEAAEAEWEEGKLARVDALALRATTGRIIVSGIALDGPNGFTLTAATEAEEREIIETTWDFVLNASPLITWNGMAFDLDYLVKRTVLLGVCPDLKPFSHVGIAPLRRRYVTDRHVDIRMLWNDWNPREPGKKAEMAEAFGLPAQEHSGKDVGRLYREGNIAAIAAHCITDLLETWLMFQRMAPLYLGRAA